jgi:hypothetical protein
MSKDMSKDVHTLDCLINDVFLKNKEGIVEKVSSDALQDH